MRLNPDNPFLDYINTAVQFIALNLIFVVSLLYLFPGMKVFMLVIGYSFTAYVNSLLLIRLFRRYEEKSEQK